MAVLVQRATFVHPKEKKPSNSPRKLLDEDDQEKQSNMSDKITAQLETICQTLTSVESRLQNLENIFERASGLEKSISNFGTELSKLNNKTKEIEKGAIDEKTASDANTAMALTNTEIEASKKKEMTSENKIKELEDKLLYQEVYDRRENLRFFGIPEPTSGTEDVHHVVHTFLKEKLELEITEDIEFKECIVLEKRRQVKQDRLSDS